MSTKPIQIEESLHRRLKVTSSAYGMKIQDVANQALKEWLEKNSVEIVEPQEALLIATSEGSPAGA